MEVTIETVYNSWGVHEKGILNRYREVGGVGELVESIFFVASE